MYSPCIRVWRSGKQWLDLHWGASWRKNSWGREGEMELLFARKVLTRKPLPPKNKSCSQRKPAILTENNGDLVDLIVKDTENISLFLLEPCWSSLPVLPLCVCRWLGSLSFHTEVPVAWTNPITLFPLVPLVAKASIWNRTEVIGEGEEEGAIWNRATFSVRILICDQDEK